ncbi:MAG: sialate O-acetylesterase, partial [Candidatus Scatosoma sp.]
MMKNRTKRLTLATLAVGMAGALSAGGVGLSRSLFPKAQETYGLTQENFYVRGASVRIVDDEYGPGVKFHVVMDKSVYDALPEGAVTGTVVLPQGLLAEGESLSKETEKAESRDTTLLWFENEEGNMESVTYVYDIPSANYGTDLAVVGYVTVAENTVYSKSGAVSMAWVAQAEYEDAASDFHGNAGLEQYFTFSLTYNDGAAETVRYGEKLTAPETPVAPEGKYFAGWTNKGGSLIWNFETDVITGNTALYPKFEDKQPAKVIVLAGQSNMVGHSFANHLTEEQLEKYRAGFENVQIYYSNNPFGTESKNVSESFVNVVVGQGKGTDTTTYPDGTFGPELGLAEYLSETYPDETFYLIKDATGGTTLHDRWYSPSSYGYLGVEEAAENNLYNHLLSWVDSGMSMLDGKNLVPEIVAFCWMQGENDAKDYFDDYTLLWTNFVSDLTAEWKGKGYLPQNGLSVIDGGITDYWTNYSEINYIKQTYAEARSKSYFIDVANSPWVSYDKDNSDYAHLDVAAMLELGKAYGENVTSAIADLVNPAVISELPGGRWDGLSNTALSGGGTQTDPYLVSTERDLAALQLTVSAENAFAGKYFKLTENITVRHPNFKGIGIIDGAYNATPEELITAAFSGVFDGDGHSVSVNIKSTSFAALFRANTGTVKNLTVAGNIRGGTYDVGGVVGYNYGGSIENCVNEAVLSSSAATPFHYGGVAGYSYGGVISGCKNFAAIVLEGGHTF